MDADAMIIELKNVSFSYDGKKPVLDGVDFHLHRGEKIGLIGPNGSGKSTLFSLIMGLLAPSAGTISLFGRPARTEADFRQARRRIGLLFQNADDQLFSPTVIEDVAFGPLNLGMAPELAREKAQKTLQRLELGGFEDRVTHLLSGGEKKLVSLATILVMEPEVLLLDEPTTGLDEATCQRIMEILNDMDIGAITVSHEYDFLARTTREIFSIRGGKILFNGSSADLHSHYHIHPAGKVPHDHPHSHDQPHPPVDPSEPESK
jgi:cobalt/nickel transport system ATP-binding protein